MYRCLTNNAPVCLCDHFNAVSDVHFMVLEVMSTVIYMCITSNERLLNSPCFIWVLQYGIICLELKVLVYRS